MRYKSLSCQNLCLINTESLPCVAGNSLLLVDQKMQPQERKASQVWVSWQKTHISQYFFNFGSWWVDRLNYFAIVNCSWLLLKFCKIYLLFVPTFLCRWAHSYDRMEKDEQKSEWKWRRISKLLKCAQNKYNLFIRVYGAIDFGHWHEINLIIVNSFLHFYAWIITYNWVLISM